VPNRHLNYFRSYSSLVGRHEDRLTRAALVLMRLVPLAHAEFLHLTDPQASLATSPQAEFDTQTTRLHPSYEAEIEREGEAGGSQPLAVQSVFLSPDYRPVDFDVDASDRTPRYDGVIRYGDQLVVVIESKLDEGADPWQASQINLGDLGSHYDLRGRGRAITWHGLFERWQQLDENDLLAHAERRLLGDFFDFVEEDGHAGLLPFKTLGRAGGNARRVDRRLRSLLEEASNLDAQWQDHWCIHPDAWRSVERVALERDGDRLRIAMWPGYRAKEARALYEVPERLERLVSLETGPHDVHWWVCPHIDLVAWPRGAGYVHLTGSEEAFLSTYIAFWSRNTDLLHERAGADIPALFDRLVNEGLAAEEDRMLVNAAFVEPRRSKVNVRPALGVYASWDWETAVRMDEGGQLVRAVIGVVNTALEALGEVTHWPVDR
jgi:hypothetical protein